MEGRVQEQTGNKIVWGRACQVWRIPVVHVVISRAHNLSPSVSGADFLRGDRQLKNLSWFLLTLP